MRTSFQHTVRGTVALIVATCSLAFPQVAGQTADQSPPRQDDADTTEVVPTLADARPAERETLARLLDSPSWPRRALAAMRLARFGCEDSHKKLRRMLDDNAWQVRCFALRSFALRGDEQKDDWLEDEFEPRVIRNALRHRYTFDSEKLARGVQTLFDSGDLEQKMLGIELAVPTGDEQLLSDAEDEARKIIFRMSRAEAGALSPRLAAITGRHDLKKPHEWERWLPSHLAGMDLRPVFVVPEERKRLEMSTIAAIDTERFAELESYIEELGGRHVDLAICLDCTASMWSELADAQGGIDDLMLFVGDVVASMRVAIVGYRDRRERFETRAWPFTYDINEARQHLWSLTAAGGGDEPESVRSALRLAFTQLNWNMAETCERVVVLVGDAPPHVGEGFQCIELAKRGARHGWTTHVIQADGEDVKHFPEIAGAGKGQCVTLEDNASIITEITGLTLGDRFSEEMNVFFQTYLFLCR